ncbi:hypothetical protein C9I56_27810 [Paraburkholderia caribensis]|uniref:Uncharacterized protein n=1 Tax=Paraburkholderia caribensis TaxID=75105 RepID=A0A9Q6S5X9_9BURK|nr:hypothetical protein C9I56_27810 [Paraburkholderia caribensis]QLB65093.1 hypothetical protein A9O66_22065 [Paraburkholderia caribensis]
MSRSMHVHRPRRCVFVAAFAQIEPCIGRFLGRSEQRLVITASRGPQALRWRIAQGASVRRPTEHIDLLV